MTQVTVSASVCRYEGFQFCIPGEEGNFVRFIYKSRHRHIPSFDENRAQKKLAQAGLLDEEAKHDVGSCGKVVGLRGAGG